MAVQRWIVKQPPVGPDIAIYRPSTRPERFELPTFGSVDRRSIQLSYGRTERGSVDVGRSTPGMDGARSARRHARTLGDLELVGGGRAVDAARTPGSHVEDVPTRLEVPERLRRAARGVA